jgi:hypothetical protein
MQAKGNSLKDPYGSQITVYGDREINTPRVISMIQAKELLRRGCEAYLVYVVNQKPKTLELHEVPVVQYFPDVFPEDLTGVPPDREIEFQIDLLPSVQPVAKASYQLAPYKMKELMTQLKDLLDKGLN